METLHIKLDLTVPSVLPRFLLVGGLLLAWPPGLASENVTLSTYYPAPSGVYSQMITTGNTFLARDGGVVDVGTSAPQSGTTKLAVMGGDVGIETVSPQAPLDVNGDAVVRGDLTAKRNIVLGGVGRAAWPQLQLGPNSRASVVQWVPAPWSGTHSGDCPPGYVVTGAEVMMRGTCQNKCDGDGPIWGSLILHCSMAQVQ
jgi:hypothetical protein